MFYSFLLFRILALRFSSFYFDFRNDFLFITFFFPFFYDSDVFIALNKQKRRSEEGGRGWWEGRWSDMILFVYLDSFEPFPTPVPFQSLDNIPTYKNDINESGIT